MLCKNGTDAPICDAGIGNQLVDTAGEGGAEKRVGQTEKLAFETYT